MTDDEILDAARDDYLDEAEALLGQFEAALLGMEADPDDRESIGAAFRAAHTIKGGGGLFGYDAVVDFTHHVETLLDAVRDGTHAPDADTMAALLDSRDQIGALLGEVRSGRADAALARRSAELGARLHRLTAGGAPAARAVEAAPTATDPAAARPMRNWHLSLRFGADALRNGIDPLAFIRYLSTLGEVRRIRTRHEAVPPLESLDPEGCCLGFEIDFAGDVTRERIDEVFEFAREDCDIAVRGPEAAPAESDRPADPAGLAADPCAPAAGQPAAGTAATCAPAERRAAAPERRTEEVRFVRVRADKLDRLIGLIGEMVIAGSAAQLSAAQRDASSFSEAAQRVCDLIEEARDGALGLRMVPIGETFGRFQRVVRDIGKQLGKDIELSIAGGDTELDKSMVETLSDPLTHLVRNSLDHGIEPAEARVAAGKPATGRLTLNAWHEAGSIVIEVGDDGRGMDPARIRAKAVERGLIDADAVLSDENALGLVFLPGFSTAEQVTDLSGRGVGMDVVKRNIEALRGQIGLHSRLGEGTTTQIRLPLTLAMIDGFLVGVGGVQYVLPLAIVAECIEAPASCGAAPEAISGLFDLRGEVMPWLDLGRFHGHVAGATARRSLVVVRDGAVRVGLVVERLHGEHQTVIKPLSSIFRHLRAISGSTILGSGEVALVLDVQALVAAASGPGAGSSLATNACRTPAAPFAVAGSNAGPALRVPGAPH